MLAQKTITVLLQIADKSRAAGILSYEELGHALPAYAEASALLQSLLEAEQQAAQAAQAAASPQPQNT